VTRLTQEFLTGYYGAPATPYLNQYTGTTLEKLKASHRKLDIYGNPVNEYNTWLSPENIDQYSQYLDKAEAAAEGRPEWQSRLLRCRLPLDYTVLQQSRLFGIEKHGIWVKDDHGSWIPRPKFREKVNAFVDNCKKAGVTELSEGGLNPAKYQEEWDSIFAAGVAPGKLIDATTELRFPFAEDFPARGNKTLTDGSVGYKDFSYNWLCFYGVPLAATITPASPVSCSTIHARFLDDPRHWIFPPDSVSIDISVNGGDFKSIYDQKIPVAAEHFDIGFRTFDIPVKLKRSEKITAIRFFAACPTAFPAWRDNDRKKPMIACDEVSAY
jgi:hypothetical protein